ncbi:tryptophan--tRNA ligase [Brockia lithotrophica]|uniref:Tryptophan--tRNA ligase n=1 Tax=Brockia lithotrophica TaxID=933949 RepID=A0A660KW59_9BACL|nr:tryptophan--tRNA ligase [Brockia lithotrophica]RKQ85622.1 tryptophanyl-tRNA synthetase [Brockia lithotrophica]
MIVFSGVQPTGTLTLGNYFGAIRHFVALQDVAKEAYYSIVDLHAVTVPHDPSALAAQTRNVARYYVASGLDPRKSVLFVQSHVPAHAELAWILTCVVRFGELMRMTQFKEKSEGRDTVSAGLFTYPALMAADILLYQTTHVPVGEDQKQHLELTRDLAERFNRDFGPTFVVPEALIPPVGARIMSLDDPTKKMSKSNPNDASRINLSDPPEVIRRKIRRATTDSGQEIRYDPEQKPGISNLLVLMSLSTGIPIPELESRYAGASYKTFKEDVAEAIVSVVEPLRDRALELLDSEVDRLLAEGAERAEAKARVTLALARERMGFLPRRNG